ncbi:hypothetical protein PISMIDRAFT_17478, partial [Pisolithus microcarpus 441]
MRVQSKGKQPRKTKQKYPESSGYNPSGNSMATQIGITEEQPLPVAEIEWQLQTEAHTYHHGGIDNDQEDRMPSTSGHVPQFTRSVPVSEHPYERFFLGSQVHTESGPCSETFSLQSSLAYPSFLPELGHTSSTFPESQTHVEFNPMGYTNPPQSKIFNPASSLAYPIQEVQCGGSLLPPYPYFPPELDYALPTLTTRFLHQPVSRVTPYNVWSQRLEAIERPLRPGETMPNEAFSISRRSVIQNILPTTDELKVMIRQALHDAAVNYDKVGVKDWLAKNTKSEVKKLKDITTNIHNNFKNIACILALPLYDLVIPIQRRDQEAALRRQQVPILCSDFTWLDGDFTDECGTSRVPFGHTALTQIVLNLLWGEKQYWRYLQVGNTDLTWVIAFAGTILHQVLDEYAGGTFSAQEFNARTSGALYKTLYTRAVSLEGRALASYIKLMEDLHARGAEMKGENYELSVDLNSEYRDKRKDAIKRVIASMTVGKDVSGLFPDVLKNMQTEDLEQKKLVYLYLMNYAKTQPELVILAVNTFVKDSEDPNPLVRALSIRTMGCLRAERIIDYLCDPLNRALKDENPYVRKTAALCVAKLYDLKPSLVIDNGFLSRLHEMIADSNPM